MATGYVDFYDKKGNGSAVRVNYEETLNQSAGTSTIRITSVQVMSTARYQYVFYGCGSVCVTGNGSGTTTVLTMANSNTHQAYVGALNTWCTISNTSCSGVTVPNSGTSDGAIISLVSYTGYSDFNVFCSGYAAGNIEITAPSHRNIGLTSYSNAPTQNPSTISMPGSATVGDLVSISINSESTSYRHNLSYSFNGSSWTPIVSNLSSSSYSWDTSNTAPDFGSEIQKTCYVRCVTTSGNSQVGDAQIASIVLSIGGSITLNAITVTPVNDNTVIRNWSGGSLFVQGYTRAQVAVSCTPSPGASLSVCRISINGTVIGEGTATTVTTNSPIAESGTLTVSVLVTDSRGNSATDSASINVYPYTRPYATFANAIRYSGNVNTEDKDNGTNLSAKATIAYSSVNGNNSASVKVRFKAAGGTYPTSYTTLTSGSASYKKINSSAVSTEESYTVQFVISDALHAADADPTTIEITIPTKSVVLHARDGGSNLSIGGYGTDGIDGFEVHWDTFLRARLILGGTMYGVGEPTESGDEEVGQVYFQLIE